LPELAPSEALVKQALEASDEKAWQAFTRRFRAEMRRSEKLRLLTLLASLSHTTNFSVGCYCVDESRCHRSVLRALFVEAGADMTE